MDPVTTTTKKAKLKFDLALIRLAPGSHGSDIPKNPNCEVCFNEYVSLLPGGHSVPDEMTDHPDSMDPALTNYSIRLNDRWDDESRQRLKEFGDAVIGTRGSLALTRKREQFLIEGSLKIFMAFLRGLPSGKLGAAADRIEKLPLHDREAMQQVAFENVNEMVRSKLPKLLRAANRPELAERCEQLAPVKDYASAHKARSVTYDIRCELGWWDWRAAFKAAIAKKLGPIAAIVDSAAIAAIADIAAIAAIAASAASAGPIVEKYKALHAASVDQTLVLFKAAIELRV